MGTKYYKHPQFGHVYGEDLTTPVGRLCWPSFVTPKDPPPPQPGQAPGAPRFEGSILLAKGNAKVDAFLAAISEMTTEMVKLFNEGRGGKLGEVSLIDDGDTYDAEKYPYYVGKWVLTARNAKQPQTIGRDEADIAPNTFVGGQKVRFFVQPLVTAHGVSYKLKLVQFIEDDGVKFAGGTKNLKSLLTALSDDDENCDGGEAPAKAPAKAAAPKTTAAKVTPPAATAVAKPASAKPPVATSLRERAAQGVKKGGISKSQLDNL